MNMFEILKEGKLRPTKGEILFFNKGGMPAFAMDYKNPVIIDFIGAESQQNIVLAGFHVVVSMASFPNKVSALLKLNGYYCDIRTSKPVNDWREFMAGYMKTVHDRALLTGTFIIR